MHVARPVAAVAGVLMAVGVLAPAAVAVTPEGAGAAGADDDVRAYAELYGITRDAARADAVLESAEKVQAALDRPHDLEVSAQRNAVLVYVTGRDEVAARSVAQTVSGDAVITPGRGLAQYACEA
jgi:hypothetical protein